MEISEEQPDSVLLC